MPRQARLDAPGTLHHVIIRGLERRAIVKDDVDREAFVTRLGAMAQATGTPIYGWALLPNHAHVLLRSGPTGIPRFMRRLLTGYAITFNRRHRRVGHLFQNRYKSIVCEEEAYFRELVRYIHLNPLRAKLVPDLNDGVRLNIRPFMSATDVGKKSAGILRAKPNIHWNKDRGTDVASAPWFKIFKGERINDPHLTLEEKRKAREGKGPSA
jgi:REP element-mobilizing transposase RayT